MPRSVPVSAVVPRGRSSYLRSEHPSTVDQDRDRAVVDQRRGPCRPGRLRSRPARRRSGARGRPLANRPGPRRRARPRRTPAVCPLRTSPSSVNCGIARTAPAASTTDRFSFPCSSSNTRRPLNLRRDIVAIGRTVALRYPNQRHESLRRSRPRADHRRTRGRGDALDDAPQAFRPREGRTGARRATVPCRARTASNRRGDVGPRVEPRSSRWLGATLPSAFSIDCLTPGCSSSSPSGAWCAGAAGRGRRRPDSSSR